VVFYVISGWVLTVCCYVPVYSTILSHSTLEFKYHFKPRTSGVAVQIRRNKVATCWHPESRTGSMGPPVQMVGTALDGGDLLAACLSHLSAVECLPERRLGHNRTMVDTVQKRHTAPDGGQNMCFPGHPPQNTVTCNNLYLTKN